MTTATNPTILCILCKTLGLTHDGDHIVPSPEQQDMTERFRPTDEQIAAAVEALAGGDMLAAVPLALPGKKDGWWTVGQPVEPVEGLWIGHNSFDAQPSYAAARNAASLAASAALGERDGTPAYACIHADGTWAVFEDVRLYPAPCGEPFDTVKAAADHQWHCDQCAGAIEAQGSNVIRYLLVEVTLPDGSAGTGDPERAHTALMGEVSEFVAGDPRVTDVEVTQVFPGDVVSAEDVPEDTPPDPQVEKALDTLLSDSTIAEIGQHMSCSEVDAFATVLAVLGRTDDAALWVLAHSHDDEGTLTDDPDDAFDNARHLAMRDADGDGGIGSEAGLALAREYVTTLLAVA